MLKPHSEARAAFIQTQQLHAAMADTFLEHMCCLDTDSPPITAWSTGIICTMGPASPLLEMLKKTIKSGMNVAHRNSHGAHEYHTETIKNVCTATESFASDSILYQPIAVAPDTKGPEIPAGPVKGSGTAEVELKKGNILWLDYKNICKVVEVGCKIYVDDGLISLQVKQKDAHFLVTEVENGGSLGSKKGVNLPGAAVDLPAMLEKDIQDLKFGGEQDVDMMFSSFICKTSDIPEVRKVLGEKGKNRKVFLAQRMMIGWCNQAGKPMLEDVIKKLHPTWAEGSGVANAVLVEADSIMLSGETAKGNYPLEAVHMQHLIACEAEATIYHLQLFEEFCHLAPITSDPAEATAVGTVEASFKCCSGAIIVLTKSVARYCPRAPMIVVTWNPQAARQAHLYHSIFPVLCFFKKDDVVIVLTW
uniref:Pyruvate kinase n=1 Tax=Gorilla gorilla gorilla TaxID=9595 RepID=A0A2I2ZJE2_GORGO